MFTREDLLAELPRLLNLATPPLEAFEFGHQDFDVPCSEQMICAFRGSRPDFENGLHFWVTTLQVQCSGMRTDFLHSYARGGVCEPIVEHEFIRIVKEYSDSLVKQTLPSFLTEIGDFRWGLRMHADWNDVGVVAEIITGFVAFYWSTTA